MVECHSGGNIPKILTPVSNRDSGMLGNSKLGGAIDIKGDINEGKLNGLDEREQSTLRFPAYHPEEVTRS
jgi:hypothetical protein